MPIAAVPRGNASNADAPDAADARHHQALRHDRSGGVCGEAGGAAAGSCPGDLCGGRCCGRDRCQPSDRHGLGPAGAQGIRAAVGAVVTARHGSTLCLTPPPPTPSSCGRPPCEKGRSRTARAAASSQCAATPLHVLVAASRGHRLEVHERGLCSTNIPIARGDEGDQPPTRNARAERNAPDGSPTATAPRARRRPPARRHLRQQRKRAFFLCKPRVVFSNILSII